MMFRKFSADRSANVAVCVAVSVILSLTPLHAQLSEPIIVDNGAPGTSSTGSWSVSGGSVPYPPGDPASDSLWARNGATYTWSFTPPQMGTFEVSMWWSGYPSRASNIPVEITHLGGVTALMVNQQVNPGAWNTLGEFVFDQSGSVMLTAAYGSDVSSCADAVRFTPVPGAPAEIVIDNRSPNTAWTGTWATSGGADPYGSDSVWSRDGATFSFLFTAPATGDYQLLMWWTEYASRGTQVPVTIENAGADNTVFINQTADGGQWNLLGTYPFSIGETYAVTIQSQPGPASTCADAVKFVYAMEPELDRIVIVGPGTVSSGDSVRYHCEAHYTNGTVQLVDADWTIVSGPVDITADGTLTAGVVDTDAAFEIRAGYAEEGIIREYVKPGTVTVAEVPSAVVVDDGDPGTSSTGTWSLSGGTGPYGTQSLWSRDGATYTWSFIPAVSGFYAVEMWWTQYSSRGNRIPVRIQQPGRDPISVDINQRENGSRWNLLQVLYLSAGAPAEVTITAEPGPASTCADAVRFSITDPPALDHLAIHGPMSVDKNAAAQYTCTAHFTDGSQQNVSPDSWALDVSPDHATIADNGLLSVHEVNGDIQCNVSATYTVGDTTATGRMRIFIRSLEPPVVLDDDSVHVSSTGTWSVSGGADPYGDHSLFSRDGATFTWHVQPPVTGFYEANVVDGIPISHLRGTGDHSACGWAGHAVCRSTQKWRAVEFAGCLPFRDGTQL